MRSKRLVAYILPAVFFLGMTGNSRAGHKLVILPEDEPGLEFVGQFINSGTSSNQFGYLSNIQGLSSVFSGTAENETTAMFTFFTEATTVRVINNGPFKIINRVGTTTIYFNVPPAGDFTNPDSFRSGTPIQVSDYSQQVVFDTSAGVFTTVHLNTITSVSIFNLAGTDYQLGLPRQSFRTNYLGHINSPGLSPSGWFGGYAVGVSRSLLNR